MLALFTLLYSCSSNKYQFIEYYINKDNKNKETAYLINEKIPFERVKAIILSNYTMSRVKDTSMINLVNTIKDINDSENQWKSNEIKTTFFNLVPEDSLNYIKSIYKSDIFYFYKISNVFYSNNGNRAFFNVIKIKFASGVVYDKVIVLKKRKSKWIVENEYESLDLH